ncbi:hypothetical protein RTP6_002006 [Batrachochytrium dendrobatidis]
MKFTDILFLLAAAVTANAVLVSTGSNGLSETSGLSSSIYKRGRETPSDEDQSGNNDSNQGTASGGDNELIRQLEKEFEEANNAEEVAANAFYKYRALRPHQERLILQGKPIYGEKHSEQRQQELKKKWHAADKRMNLLRQKLQEARRTNRALLVSTRSARPGPSTSRQNEQHSIDEPGPSTSRQDEQYPDIDPSPCTTKPSRKLPSDREYPRETRELIQQLVQELEAADTAETVACDTSYGYRVVEHEQEKSISQGKPISGKKHSKQRQYRLDSQWQTAWRKVEFLEQKLQQARSSTSGRGRKHSIDKSGPSTSRRGGKRPSDEDQSNNADLNQKVMSRKANRHLRKLMKKVEKAIRAKTAKCDAYRRSMSFEVEQDSEYILKTRKKLDKECKKEKGKVDRLKRRLERLSKKNDLEFGAESD